MSDRVIRILAETRVDIPDDLDPQAWEVLANALRDQVEKGLPIVPQGWKVDLHI